MIIDLDLVVGKQKNSGRIYSEDCLKQAISNIKYPLYVDLHNSLEVNLEEFCGIVDYVFIEDNKVKANFILAERAPTGIILKHMIDEQISLLFRAAGVGKVGDNSVVSEFKILKIFVDINK